VRHFEEEPSGNLLFMRDPRTTKEQAPICNLTVTLPSSSEGTVSTGSTVDTDELQQKLQMLKQLECKYMRICTCVYVYMGMYVYRCVYL